MEEKRTKMDGQRKLTPLETLKAYHDFKQFRKYMYVAIDKMPKWLKHSEGANCIVSIKTCVRCLSVISRTYVSGMSFRTVSRFSRKLRESATTSGRFNLRKGTARMLFERFGRAVQLNEHYNKMIIVKSYV